VVQGSGSGFLVSSDGDNFQIGSYILISGLALQVTAFGFFTITAIRFDIKYKREFGLEGRERFAALLYCLYVSCVCILVSFLFQFFYYFVLFSFLRVGLACGRLSSPQHPSPACGPAESGRARGVRVFTLFSYISFLILFSFSSRFHWGMYLRTPAPLITWSRVAKWPSTQRGLPICCRYRVQSTGVLMPT